MVTGIVQFSWSPNGVPAAGDTAVILHNITVSDVQECATLDVDFVFGKKLTISGSGASLTVLVLLQIMVRY